MRQMRQAMSCSSNGLGSCSQWVHGSPHDIHDTKSSVLGLFPPQDFVILCIQGQEAHMHPRGQGQAQERRVAPCRAFTLHGLLLSLGGRLWPAGE